VIVQGPLPLIENEVKVVWPVQQVFPSQGDIVGNDHLKLRIDCSIKSFTAYVPQKVVRQRQRSFHQEYELIDYSLLKENYAEVVKVSPQPDP